MVHLQEQALNRLPFPRRTGRRLQAYKRVCPQHPTQISRAIPGQRTNTQLATLKKDMAGTPGFTRVRLHRQSAMKRNPHTLLKKRCTPWVDQPIGERVQCKLNRQMKRHEMRHWIAGNHERDLLAFCREYEGFARTQIHALEMKIGRAHV